MNKDPDRWLLACCFLCSTGCGIDIGVKDDQPGGCIVGVRGRGVDVVNRGRLGWPRRGVAEAPARIGDIEPGTLFMPFHYGYWDDPCRSRAANELTLYDWDPVSKQPHFKYAAVKLEKAEGLPLPQPDESKRETPRRKARASLRAGPTLPTTSACYGQVRSA